LDPEQQLSEAVSREGLASFDAEVLMKMARDPHGLDEDAAAWFVASITSRSHEECSRAIIHLLGRGLLIQVDENGVSKRLFANFERLGLDEATRQALLRESLPFEVLGAPHSPKAMETLNSFFREEREDIYLGIEVTHHDIFRELNARANARKSTVFLMPRKRHVSTSRKEHYDEVLKDWIGFIQNGPRERRTYVQLRITSSAHRALFTSAMSPRHARLDYYSFDSTTTREGQIVSVPARTSLYDLVYRRFCEAVHSSRPLFRLWPRAWIIERVKKYWLIGVGIALAISAGLVGGSLGAVIAALVGGLIANAVFDIARARVWGPPDLYER